MHARYLQQMCYVLKGLPEGAFPPLELEWLAAAAWNRGCHHERFGRQAAAKDFVRATRELVRHSPMKSERLQVRVLLYPAATLLPSCAACSTGCRKHEGVLVGWRSG